jgi:hypothetical protein
LGAILVHELGHVAGCGHTSGTIMDENLVSMVRIYESPGAMDYHLTANIGWIDLWGRERRERYRELLLCEPCEYAAPGTTMLDDSYLFEKLTGGPAFPKAFYAVHLAAKKDFEKGIRFTIGAYDEAKGWGGLLKQESFTLEAITQVALFPGDAPVFKLVFQGAGDKAPTTISSRTKGAVYSATVRLKGGETIPFVIKRNALGETLVIDHLPPEGGTKRLYELNTVLKSYGITI